jgi:hypothetical protein
VSHRGSSSSANFTSHVLAVKCNVIPANEFGYHSCECRASTNQIRGTITTGAGDYHKKARCSWLISSPSKISLVFTSFNTEYTRDTVSLYSCASFLIMPRQQPDCDSVGIESVGHLENEQCLHIRHGVFDHIFRIKWSKSVMVCVANWTTERSGNAR